MVSNRAKKSRTAAAEDDDQFERDDMLLAIEKLQEAQEELEKVNEEANEKILEIEQKYNEMREPVYAKRNEVISSIPDFWLTAFMNHPTLGDLLTEEDQKIFKYLDSLEVEDFKDPRKGYCITFNFKANPYFENTELTKTIKFFDEGTLRSTGTTIRWKEGKGPADASNDPRKGNKRPLNLSSFFSWFGFPPEGTVEVEQDVVAELIKEDLWPNPIEHLNNEDDEDYTEDDDDDDDDEGDEDDNDEGDEDGCGNDDE
ncbi:UNVERIFIED_CONTAM: NAP1-related protein 2 [Sesamum latifolium]|uniref:NAP1-related protein 2 n=1 Tax=Sesamum latifolium TaxID=2727402 RepID=A0AAW2XAN9_9LAMI